MPKGWRTIRPPRIGCVGGHASFVSGIGRCRLTEPGGLPTAMGTNSGARDIYVDMGVQPGTVVNWALIQQIIGSRISDPD
jgi:hypothetical protein